jgi:hypothetical protein
MGRFTRLAREEMNMNRMIVMSKVRTSGCALVIFGALVLSASAAPAQTCTPVVLAFRHAEDTNPPNPPGPIFALTPTGARHAELYAENNFGDPESGMVSQFVDRNGFCKVTKVYAASKVTKKPCSENCASATNAFDTASPLAKSVMSADPITKVGNDPNDVNTQLWEYLGNGQNAKPNLPINYDTTVAKQLRNELLETAKRGESSAIFWTSQGLHVLGGVILDGDSIVPDKNADAGTPLAGTPPRNAVYLFTAVNVGSNLKFEDTPSTSRSDPVLKTSVFVQCFNRVEKTDSPLLAPTPRTFAPPPFVCGFGINSNLGYNGKKCPLGEQCGTIPNDENSSLKGFICNTTTEMIAKTSASEIFGECP